MSTRPWKDSADWSYLSQDSTWHILRGHTFCSLNLYSWTIRNSYLQIMQILSQAVNKSYWGHSWMGKWMEPIEQGAADLRLRPLKIFIKMRSIHLSHSFRICQTSQRVCNFHHPVSSWAVVLARSPSFPCLGLYKEPYGVWYPSGQLGSAVLLLVSPSLLPGGVGWEAEGSLATTKQQLEHQCVINCSHSKSNHSTAAATGRINCTPAKSRTVDNTSVIIIALPATQAELGGLQHVLWP